MRAYAKYLRQAGLSLQPVLHRVGAQRTPLHRTVTGRRCSRRFSIPAVGFADEPRRASGRRRGRRRHRRAGEPGHRPHPARIRVAGAGHVADQLLCDTGGFGPRPQCAVDQAGRPAGRRAAAAAPQVRDLRVFAPRRRRAPEVRPGGARRPALVGPPRRLPHRDPRSGQGASGEERRHRAGRRQGRVRPQAAAAAHR